MKNFKNNQSGSASASRSRDGFTLIEILVVIGLIAILAAVVIIAINPARQFAQGRNSQRTSNVNSILNAIGQNMADNKGVFSCNGSPFVLPTTATDVAKGGSADLRPCIVPTYMPELPYDPSVGSNTCTTTGCSGAGESYDTKYTVQITTTGRTEVCAPKTNESNTSVQQDICVTR